MVQFLNIIFYQDVVLVTDNTDKSDINVADFEKIYRDYLAYVFRYVYFRLNDRELSEELTSLVFEKAITHFNTYKKDLAAPQTWLISIARNTVTDYFRKSSRRSTVPLDDVLGVESRDPSPQEQVESSEELERLRFCFAGLNSREQDIVSLKFSWELNNRKIASVVNLSENNVGTILYRAVCKLRKCIKDWVNGSV
jgi:RNA polymerase sigma factor (sigma-70 family)